MKITAYVHPLSMKLLLFLLTMVHLTSRAQDTLHIYTHRYLVERDLTCCRSAKNQLKCIDSLIQVNLNATNYSGKIDVDKARLDRLRKLGIYHFYGALINGLRGNLAQSFLYFDAMERYVDTLSQNGKPNELQSLNDLVLYEKQTFCFQMFHRDTAVFNHCNCMQFFPSLKDEAVTTDTTNTSKKAPLHPKQFPEWGAFYRGDTLRMNSQFVSNRSSITYFRQSLQPALLTVFLQNPAHLEMLGDIGNEKNLNDTVIYRLAVNYEKGSYQKNCEIVFTTARHPEKFDYFLFLISNIEFSGFVKDFEIYIPLVVTTDFSNSNRASIFDDHFRLEIERIKPIKQLNSE